MIECFALLTDKTGLTIFDKVGVRGGQCNSNVLGVKASLCGEKMLKLGTPMGIRF